MLFCIMQYTAVDGALLYKLFAKETYWQRPV